MATGSLQYENAPPSNRWSVVTYVVPNRRSYFLGNVKAMSDVCSPCPLANTMYCLP
jgi:hypothetical protein